MKTRTNQPLFKDNGEQVNDNELGGTKLYAHELYINTNNHTFEFSIITTDGQEYNGIFDIRLGINLISGLETAIGNHLVLSIVTFNDDDDILVNYEYFDTDNATAGLVEEDKLTSIEDIVTAL